MRILYIGDTETHRQYLEGNVPSHWFYGACEMERDGHVVVWAEELSDWLNDFELIRQYRPDIVFIPNLNIHNHLLMLLAARFIKAPIYAYLHHEPAVKLGLKAKMYRFLLSSVKHLFFLSEKSMNETVKAGLINPRKCSVPGWGPDMEFYNKIQTSDNGWYVSTGKENRDFDTLIEAFKRTGAPLHIITAKSHGGVDYTDINDRCNGTPNIKVTIVDNSSANYPMMLREMAAAHALVCPLRQDKLNYCVGLSTVADAEGLRKPLIITVNPYHNAERVSKIGISATTVEEWIDAIKVIQEQNLDIQARSCMADAYSRMKFIMKL